MVYIIGIDHLVQYNGPLTRNILNEFRNFMISEIGRLDISLIAEEFNEEFLHDVFAATEGTAKSLAELTGVEHIYCDPDERERKILGIPYYADVKDMVKHRYGIKEKIIFDNKLRKIIEHEIHEEVRKYWHVRENFWLETIKGKVQKNILFLCGYEHVPGFSILLASKGIDCIVIDPYWRKDLFSDYSKLGLR